MVRNQAIISALLVLLSVCFLLWMQLPLIAIGAPVCLFAAVLYQMWVNGNLFTARLLPGTTLLVVDMQLSFLRKLTNSRRTVEAVLVEIARAISQDQTILIVKYRGCGAVDQRIIQALTGYKNWHYVFKSDDDGAATVSDACMLWRCGTACLRLVGVNLDGCVYETAVSLTQLYPQSQIEVLVNACDTCYAHGWSTYRNPKAVNVRLVDGAGNLVDPSTLPAQQLFLALPIGGSWSR